MLKFKYVESYGLEIDKNDSRNWEEIDERQLGMLINYGYRSEDYDEYLLILINTLQNGEDIVVIYFILDRPIKIVQVQHKGKFEDVLNQAIKELMSEEVLT